MVYQLWFYDLHRRGPNEGEFYRAYCVFEGNRYQCYKKRSQHAFQDQYKVERKHW